MSEGISADKEITNVLVTIAIHHSPSRKYQRFALIIVMSCILILKSSDISTSVNLATIIRSFDYLSKYVQLNAFVLKYMIVILNTTFPCIYIQITIFQILLLLCKVYVLLFALIN